MQQRWATSYAAIRLTTPTSPRPRGFFAGLATEGGNAVKLRVPAIAVRQKKLQQLVEKALPVRWADVEASRQISRAVRLLRING